MGFIRFYWPPPEPPTPTAAPPLAAKTFSQKPTKANLFGFVNSSKQQHIFLWASLPRYPLDARAT